MAADGVNTPVIEHDDTVRVLHGADALRDDDLRRLRDIGGKGLLDLRIRARVDGARRVIENKHLRLFQQRAGDAQALLLAAGDVRAALLDIGVIAVRHGGNEFIRTREHAGVTELLVRGVFVAPAEIFGDRTRKQLVFLQHHGNGVAQRLQIIIAHVHAAERQPAAGDIVQTRDELHERGLGRARAADDADRLAGTDVQINVIEHLFVRLGGVDKAHVVKVDRTVAHGHDRVLRLADIRPLLEHLGDAPRGRERDRQHGKDHREHHQAREDLHGIGDERGEIAGREAECRVIAAGDDGLGAEPRDQDHARIDAKLHQRCVERDEPLTFGKVLINARGDRVKLADLVLLLVERLHDADAAHILLHDVVELVIRAEHARKDREHAANDEKERQRQDRQNDEKRHRDIAADAKRHDHGKDQHDRRADRHTHEHLECVLHVCGVRRQACDDGCGGKLVDVRKSERLHIVVHILAQVCRKADGRARGNARGEHAGRQLERRQQQQKRAEFPDRRHTAALDAEVDEVGHEQRDHDLEHHLQRREQNRHERRAFVLPQTAGQCMKHGFPPSGFAGSSAEVSIDRAQRSFQRRDLLRGQ